MEKVTQTKGIEMDNISADGYVLIQWPESQLIMEYDWFDEEASLADCDKFGSSAFFIPKERWLELYNQ